jgi:hypothetical protein
VVVKVTGKIVFMCIQLYKLQLRKRAGQEGSLFCDQDLNFSFSNALSSIKKKGINFL